MKRRLLKVFVVLVLLLGGAGFLIYYGGEHRGPGVVTPVVTPPDVITDRVERQRSTNEQLGIAQPVESPSQILFGDLHVHSTFSADAFMRSLPMVGGTGAHPPADACDFARYCSALDFYAMTDHAESLSPAHWRETIDSVRECNDVAGDAADPDLVAFVGYEWSQVGTTRENHYGHKNVIYRGLSDEELPARPIGSIGILGSNLSNTGVSAVTELTIPIRDFSNRHEYLDFRVYRQELLAMDDCPTGVDSRELPPECRELVATPGELFERLEQWGLETIVIPHGTTWGFYTPPGYEWDKQLSPTQSHPELQNLIEVFSGHGNSEQYRPWRAAEADDDGELFCPEPTEDYEPCCWRAGELIRARCGDASEDECVERVETARLNYVNAGAAGHVTVPGASPEDWGNCGQCTDCYLPAFNYRPGGSAQYILARGYFEDPENPVYARFGFIASSDVHTSRPGTGFKEFARMDMTEAAGPISENWRNMVLGDLPEPSMESQVLDFDDLGDIAPFRLVDLERQSSFFLTGGLVAVHSEGRDREAIWEALERREVYGTSGERILLWFDLVDETSNSHPMGSELDWSTTPRFEVRAAGSFAQLPGCPAWVTEAVPAERIANLCLDECFNPSDERRMITRIEVVRIRPQETDDEPIPPLIEDPWRVIPCEPNPVGCTAEFEDPEFVSGGRDVVYYVRAIQEPSMAVNADGLRCQGEDCASVDPCFGDFRTPRSEDCLAENEERAWSSPIFLFHQPPLPVLPDAPTTAPEPLPVPLEP